MSRISGLPSRIAFRLWLGAWAVAVLAVALAAPLPAAAQSRDADLRALAEQVERLQRELNVLQRNVYQGRPAAPGAAPGGLAPGQAADLGLRLDEFEVQLRQLTGRIEEVNHRIVTLEQRFEKLSSDVDFRLSQAAGGAPTASAAAPAMAATPQPTPPAGAGNPNQEPTRSGTLGTLSARDPVPQGSEAAAAAAAAAAANAPRAAAPAQAAPSGPALPPGSPDDQYKFAFGLLSRADYAGAERALAAFVEQHPNHALAGNAQYWLGETFYARNDFNQAARAFALGYQKYPKSSKAPDNLLKLGLSLANLGRTREACQSYALLRKDFPRAPAEINRRADAEQKRLRCT